MPAPLPNPLVRVRGEGESGTLIATPCPIAGCGGNIQGMCGERWRERAEWWALGAGVAVPVIYFGSVAAAALAYPEFSFAQQFASELGAEGAPHPWILNSGIILVGV